MVLPAPFSGGTLNRNAQAPGFPGISSGKNFIWKSISESMECNFRQLSMMTLLDPLLRSSNVLFAP